MGGTSAGARKGWETRRRNGTAGATRRKRKASAPKRNILAEYENQRVMKQMARPHPPTSPLHRRNRSRQYAEYHAEIERDLALAMHNIDDYVRDGSWTKQEVAQARREARAMARHEHKQVPEWTAPKSRRRK